MLTDRKAALMLFLFQYSYSCKSKLVAALQESLIGQDVLHLATAFPKCDPSLVALVSGSTFLHSRFEFIVFEAEINCMVQSMFCF